MPRPIQISDFNCVSLAVLPAEVLQLRDGVFAHPRQIVQKTIFAVACHPNDWTAETHMFCLSGPEARLAVLLSVHRDATDPVKLEAWKLAVTSASLEFRWVAQQDDVVAEYVIAQEALNAHNVATLLTVPRRVLLVTAILRQHKESEDGLAAVEKLYTSKRLKPLLWPKEVAASDFQPRAQPFALALPPVSVRLLKLMPRVQWLTEIAQHVFSVPECLRLILEERPECELTGPQLLAI